MPLLLLLLLYLACLGGNWPRPVGIPETDGGLLTAALLSWAAIGLGVAAAGIAARRVRHRLKLNPQDRENVLRTYGGFRTYHVLAQFVIYLLALYVLGWGWVVQTTCVFSVPGQSATKV